MNRESFQIADADCSCLQLEVLVGESWINPFLDQQDLLVKVTDKYHLIHLRAELEEGKITLAADIKEKKDSTIRITCLPKWDGDQQKILLEELEIKLFSKNILLKSVGWFAKTFMGAKIDKKIEEATNKLYASKIDVLLVNGINIPISKGSSASVQVRSMIINDMIFNAQTIKVKMMIDGYWKLQLEA